MLSPITIQLNTSRHPYYHVQENVVRICKTIPARVNVKARTHEKLDSIGEGRALSCHTFVMLERTA